jgi:hypothetical protein
MLQSSANFIGRSNWNPASANAKKKILMEGGQATLIYEIDFQADPNDDFPFQPLVVINACTRKVLYYFDKVC